MDTALSRVLIYAVVPMAAIILTGVVAALHPVGSSKKLYPAFRGWCAVFRNLRRVLTRHDARA